MVKFTFKKSIHLLSIMRPLKYSDIYKYPYSNKKDQWIEYKLSELKENKQLLPYSCNSIFGLLKVNKQLDIIFIEKEAPSCNSIVHKAF